jgi:outer membrane protein OmpA-like peptidoglycan-associated protein
MRHYLTYLFLSLSVITAFHSPASAQGFNGFENSPPLVSAYFLRENITIEPESTFFNVLVINNMGRTTQEVSVDVNVPLGWSVMPLENRNFLLTPGDSVIVPIRAAPSKMVEGEIGYSVIAAINNRRGENLTNAYSFVKIPRKTNLSIRPLSRVSLFDQVTGETEFSFQVVNKGNVNELIYFQLESSRTVSIPNERDNLHVFDLMIPARSDTIIRIKAFKSNELNIENYSLFRIDMIAHTQDQNFSTSFWFEEVNNRYRFNIPETEKLLIVELAAQNLLSEQKPYLSGGFRGNVLFPQNRSIIYSFYKYGNNADIFRYSRMNFEYHTPKYHVQLGDILGFPIRNGFGKGARFTMNTGNFRATVLAGRNPFRPINNFGIMFEERYTPFNLLPRYTYTENQFINSIAQTYHLSSYYRLHQNHRIRAGFGLSDVSYRLTGRNEVGHGLLLDYDGSFGKTSVKIREHYGSSSFYSSFAGRNEFSGRINHRLRNDLQLDLFLNNRKYRPILETASGTRAPKFQETTESHIVVRKRINRNLSVFGGPLLQQKSTNSYFFFEDNPFRSQSAKLHFGARIHDGAGTYVNPTITTGYTRITDFSVPDRQNFSFENLNNRTDMFNTYVSLNLRRHLWGFYLNYFWGPYSINQEITQFYYNLSTNTIRLMPYLDTYIYKDMVKLSSKVSLVHDFTFKTNRVMLNNQVDIFLKGDYTISLLSTFSRQATRDIITNNSFTYSNNYFEIRLKKDFNWNQPRIKYYDLEIDLFRDLNGNYIRDFTEPGIKDVLVSITSIERSQYKNFDEVDYEPEGASVATRLLTSMDGKVKYENLSRGLYRIELQNIGMDAGRYFPEQSDLIVNVTGNKTIPIPFLERNKIFGRVVLNRSRLSTLGRVEVSNIKVVATDSKGRQTSTLTDGNGYFEMHVPSVDSYVVTVNNIFRDHFSLRQNDFRANLNGFKQFEVNFIFDEIRRQIEFTPSHADVQTQVRRVGRTNLNGTIRDAATLQPLRAQIEVSDNSGNTISQVNTDRNTGRYSSSFATGENYMITVSANGYWMNSERLILDPFLTIQDADRDILLEAITIGSRFQLNNLQFGPNSFEIPTEALPELERLTNQLKQNPNVRIRIEGHSDALETLNTPNIGMNRAETIMRYMVQNGFSNIEFTGVRDSRPVAPSDNENNRSRNRRVEIIVIDR